MPGRLLRKGYCGAIRRVQKIVPTTVTSPSEPPGALEPALSAVERFRRSLQDLKGLAIFAPGKCPAVANQFEFVLKGRGFRRAINRVKLIAASAAEGPVFRTDPLPCFWLASPKFAY